MRYFRLILICLSFHLSLFSQKKYSVPFQIMSYNVENLFDTEDNPSLADEDFLPEGTHYWTKGRYYKKLQHLAQVIQAAGGWNTLALVGLCEVENDSVLHHLLRRTPLNKSDYQYCITHGNDVRGINVALLYQKDQFKFISSDEIQIPTEKNERPTRNILYVCGQIQILDSLDVFVCHFPSRYGGELSTRKRRKDAAKLLKLKVDSLLRIRKTPRILIMGDFNDTPEDESLSLVLQAKPYPNVSEFKTDRLYNLFYRSKGSHKYQGEWNQLDHIIVNGALLQEGQQVVLEKESNRLFDIPFLLINDKTWRGVRPFRTYYGYKYEGGYSDHLPLLATFKLLFE